MNKLIVANLKANIVEITETDVVVAAPYPFIHQVKAIRAAQDVSQFPNGAYTGEVTAEMLKKLNVKYCLVGHAERRKYFNETNEIIQQKITRLKENNIIPILCVQTLEDILDAEYIMYEPLSAISLPGDFHPEPIENVLEFRKHISGKFLYGGSINDQNIENYLFADGFVIGQASLDPDSFKKICARLLVN
ncbi:MAG: triose-phosphate isomerase family protein [bacterium]|nr:triose-phosphate isomerase family protein [bacterium]